MASELIESTIKCECGVTTEWYYLAPSQSGSSMRAFILPKGKEAASRLNRPDEETYQFKVYCKDCDRPNIFTHTKRK
jgi:hypothetical protein